ncbi:hypothetical protein HYC85_015035 [Camellia sinensis]|uniref:Uncharacterized protein n=1 Tax=Camellia sinensis TaxID=4442 RepID=A0A7J7HB76_CAMSI|nr:hypothetical protein HYC85_015035 [Camellia sinensis]
MVSEDVEVQQRGHGEGSTHSFVPVTAENRRSEQATLGKVKYSKVQSAPPNIGIASISADLVTSLGGIGG